MPLVVKSEMAGVVETIEVEEGQDVAADTEVLVLSSMKMEIPILAGAAGRVGEILVAEGDAIKVGSPLFAIET